MKKEQTRYSISFELFNTIVLNIEYCKHISKKYLGCDRDRMSALVDHDDQPCSRYERITKYVWM